MLQLFSIGLSTCHILLLLLQQVLQYFVIRSP
jgi:hypothetical protein